MSQIIPYKHMVTTMYAALVLRSTSNLASPQPCSRDSPNGLGAAKHGHLVEIKNWSRGWLKHGRWWLASVLVYLISFKCQMSLWFLVIFWSDQRDWETTAPGGIAGNHEHAWSYRLDMANDIAISGHQTWLAGKSPFWMEVKISWENHPEMWNFPACHVWLPEGLFLFMINLPAVKHWHLRHHWLSFCFGQSKKKTRNWHHCQQKCQCQTPITLVFQAITNNKAALYRASNLCTERGSCFGYLWTSNGSKVVFKSVYETWKITACAFWDKLRTCMWSYVDTCVYIYIIYIYDYICICISTQ
jgi:hypothetical protein